MGWHHPGLLGIVVSLALATGMPSAAQVPPAPQAASPGNAAQGALLNITPRRLTFDRGRRNGSIFLLNQGTEAVTVDLTIGDRVMLPDGQIFPAEDAAKRADVKAAVDQLKSAQGLMQVSPRRVTLLPGRPQTVRIRMGGLPDPASGEHRSHLTVTTIPPRDAGTTVESAASGAPEQLSFKIVAVYGLSIPLIVRPGDADVRAAIEGAHVVPPLAPTAGGSAAERAASVSLDLVRLGSSSAYGNIEVRLVGERRGAEALGTVRGVAVYPEITRRAVRIPLSRTPLAGEKLEVTFTDDDTSPGKVLAKAVF